MELLKWYPQLPWKLLWVTDFLYTADNIARIQDCMRGKMILVFDFDGVCHDESKYNEDTESIVPLDGVIDSIQSLKNEWYTLILWSTRIDWFNKLEPWYQFIDNFLKKYHIHDCFELIITGDNMGIRNSEFSDTQMSVTALKIDHILEKNRTSIDITQKNLDLLFPQWAVLIDNNLTFTLGKWIPDMPWKYQIIIAGSGIKTYFNPDPESSRFQNNIDYLHDFSDPTEPTLKKAILDRFDLIQKYLP
jgi:hypothetical protein